MSEVPLYVKGRLRVRAGERMTETDRQDTNTETESERERERERAREKARGSSTCRCEECVSERDIPADTTQCEDRIGTGPPRART